MRKTVLIALILLLGCVQALAEGDALVMVVTHVGGGPTPCDGIFEQGLDEPIPGALVQFGDSIKLTNQFGIVSFQVDPNQSSSLSVVFPSVYKGAEIEPCPPDSVDISPDSFQGENTKWLNQVFWSYRTGVATGTPEVNLARTTEHQW